MIQGIVFDLDQTLFDRHQTFRTWISHALAEAQVCPSHQQELLELDAEGYSDRGTLLKRCAELCTWPETSPIAQRERFARELAATVTPEPELPSFLEGLRSHYHLGLLTDGMPDLQDAKIDRLGIRHCFDTIVITGTHGHPKPAREAFEVFRQRWQLPAARICMIGDHAKRDITGARAIGMQTIWISGSQTWQHPSPAPRTVSSWHELAALLP